MRGTPGDLEKSAQGADSSLGVGVEEPRRGALDDAQLWLVVLVGGWCAAPSRVSRYFGRGAAS